MKGFGAAEYGGGATNCLASRCPIGPRGGIMPPMSDPPLITDVATERGQVALVGAGPGDPKLLTLRGAELLAAADVVLYDGLSNPAILSHAAAAEQINVGKHGGPQIWKQPEIIAETLAHAARGRRVVRLKGGDPAVFARTSEEVDACIEAGIAYEIVPGITAALAAGPYAGIPITHRGLASAVALVTGHEQPGKPASDLDWDALARFPGTLVIYMGVTTARAWTTALIDGGKDPATPSALLRRCSHPDQQRIHCRLDEIADRLTPASAFRPPVIAIIGPVTELADRMDWFSRRPLFGQTVLVARPARSIEAMAGPLEELGATVLRQPAIEILPLEDSTPLDDLISRLPKIDDLIFVSSNGVDHFFKNLRSTGRDARTLAGVSVHAIGDRTRDSLDDANIAPETVGDASDAATYADWLSPHVAGRRIVIVHADRCPDDWTQLLSAAQSVMPVVGYQNVDVERPDEATAEAMRSGQVDWVAVTSSAIARRLASWFGDQLHDCRLASIGNSTTQTLQEFGYEVAAQPATPSAKTLIDAITSAPDIDYE